MSDDKQPAKFDDIKNETSKDSTDDFEHYLSDESTNDQTETVPYETNIVKLNWLRVFIVSIIVTIVFTGLTFLVIWIIGRNNYAIWAFVDWILFIEFGVFLTFGGCLGTWKQSFSLNQLNVKLFKGDKLTGADTKLAIGSSYTYIIAGCFIGIISGILFLVL